MALTREQTEVVETLEADMIELKQEVQALQTYVHESLSLLNTGGGHVFNLAVQLLKKFDGIMEKIEDLKTS
jgi:hypothetical protein